MASFLRPSYRIFRGITPNLHRNLTACLQNFPRQASALSVRQVSSTGILLNSTETMSTPSTPTSPISTEPFSITAIKPSDAEPVVEFLRRFFFRDEPLNVNIKLLDENNPTCKELEDYSVESIKYGVSLMAVSESGKLIGVCLNGPQIRDKPEPEEDCPNPKFDKILKLLGHVDEQANVFGMFPEINKVMNVKILSVDGSFRGRGIAKELMDRTRDLAREQGYCMMRVDCTSHFSARAIAKLGFECVYSLKYKDYTDKDGKPIFTPEQPHNEVTVYIQKVKC